jgi:hypothetical protein
VTEIKKRLNPVSLLRTMPAVIETRDVRVTAGWEKKAATEALFRWVRAGHVSQFAKEVFFNLVAFPNATQTHVYEAAERTLRRPMMLTGASALNQAGWTTQMPAGRELAVVVTREVRTWRRMAEITAEARTMRWYDRVSDHVIRKDGDFDALPPAFALVDSIIAAERFRQLPTDVQSAHLANGTVNWHPDPDDICVPLDTEPEEIWRELVFAAEVIGVPIDMVREYAMAIPGMESLVISDVREPRSPRI